MEKSKDLEVSEIISYYSKEWVTVNVTKRNEFDFPLKGEVILHSFKKSELVEKIVENDIQGDLYLFYCGNIDDNGNFES